MGLHALEVPDRGTDVFVKNIHQVVEPKLVKTRSSIHAYPVNTDTDYI